MKTTFAKEIVDRFVGNKVDVSGIKDWPVEDDEPLGTTDFGIVRISDDAIIIAAGGDWQENHVLELKEDPDGGIVVTRDFGDRDVGGQTKDEIEDIVLSIEAFVAGTLPSYEVGASSRPSTESVTCEIEETELAIDNCSILFLEGSELITNAGGDSQQPLEVKIGLKKKKAVVKSISKCSEFKSGLSVSDAVNRFMTDDTIDEDFKTALEACDALSGDELDLTKVEGWPRVPVTNVDDETYWRSTTAGDSKTWPSAEAIPLAAPEDAAVPASPKDVKVYKVYEDGLEVVVDNALLVTVGLKFKKLTIAKVEPFIIGATLLSGILRPLTTVTTAGTDDSGDPIDSDLMDELLIIAKDETQWVCVSGWPTVPLKHPVGKYWNSTTAKPSPTWPTEPKTVPTPALPTVMPSKPAVTKKPKDGFSKQDILKAALELKQYYGSFKSARQPSDLDLVKEAITIANDVTKLYDTVL
jgi:hypothetical protein